MLMRKKKKEIRKQIKRKRKFSSFNEMIIFNIFDVVSFAIEIK